MNLGVLKKLAIKIGEGIIEHQAEILLCTGAISAIGATVTAVKATVKSSEEVRVENEKRVSENKPKMTKTEVIKSEGKNYILTLILLMASLGSQFGGYRASVRRIAALSTAIKLSEEIHKEYIKDLEENAKLSEPQLQETEAKASNTAVENALVVAGDTDYICRIDGNPIRKNVSELKLDLEKFRSTYYLSGYQDPVTVADLHDYFNIHTYPSDYDRKISFLGGEDWYTLIPNVEGSRIYIDVDYTTRDIEKY